MSVFRNGVETINGCPVVETIGVTRIIEHPLGFMVYHGFKIGTRKTIEGARSLAKSYNERVTVRVDKDDVYYDGEDEL